MNAYELADWLKLKSGLGWADNFGAELEQAATMLRQQADRITELEFQIRMNEMKYLERIEELKERLQQYECHHGVEGGNACKECYQELTIKASRDEE